MKLSAVIEKALTSGAYNPSTPYMCHALEVINLEEFIPDIHIMVADIAPNANLGYPLICALHDSPKCTFNLEDFDIGRAEEFKYSQQFYCWWVFDLKRKGL